MGTPFTIRHSARGTVAEVLLAGDIDLSVLQPIRDAVSKHLGDPTIASVIIDISAVTFIDSSGLGTLVASRRQAGDADKNLQVTGATGRTAEIIDLTGLTDHLLGPGGPAGPTG